MIKGETSVGSCGGQGEFSAGVGGDDGSPARSVTLEPDDVFEILRNQRRRDVLRFFFEEGRTAVELGTLAEHLAAAEFETTITELTSQERKRMYVSLYQCHLPKMDEAGIIEFDSDRKTLELGANAHHLEPYLYLDETPSRVQDEAADADDESVDEVELHRYLFASLSGLLVTAATALGAVSTVVVVELLLPVVSVLVGAVGLFQFTQTRE
ncbi:hypothetical protein ACFR9U_06450 [Halorientalis brevis]|uniref:DUF7344 domain-containing protein n=1 Tax=Halorientalis brevis TaxID=1126241 RepID=A0ABD6C8G3_9EURY|nr:hypothetical protein [Halorientalis brevis]